MVRRRNPRVVAALLVEAAARFRPLLAFECARRFVVQPVVWSSSGLTTLTQQWQKWLKRTRSHVSLFVVLIVLFALARERVCPRVPGLLPTRSHFIA